MPSLSWLTARPIAHRGLHNAAVGIVENTSTAFLAAIDNGYAIECDLQISADGEAMVYHDDALGRLTKGDLRLSEMSSAELRKVSFKATADSMLTLAELCDLVAGRVPLVLELKSRFNGDLRLPRQVAAVLAAAYAGPVAVMSFDPDMVAMVRKLAPELTRGIVAERHFTQLQSLGLTSWRKWCLRNLLPSYKARPQFISYMVKDLPSIAPWIAQNLFGLPLLTWTVRGEADRQDAARWADQITFEGFRP